MSDSENNENLRDEARRWDNGELSPKGWQDAPERIPNVGESVPMTMRMPKTMLAILKEFARREDIGYQALIKRWLDERIKVERDALLAQRRVVTLHQAHVRVFAASHEPSQLFGKVREESKL